MNKPTITLDFDGVLHSYTTPWTAADVVPDRAIEGSIEWLLKAIKKVNIAIFSCRSNQDNGIPAMQRWLKRELIRWLGEGSVKELVYKQELSGYSSNGGNSLYEQGVWADNIINKILWPTSKIPSVVYVDDNAYRFEGSWPKLDELLKMDTWVKDLQ